MIVGMLHLELRIPWAHSLKDKRMVVRSVVERARHRFRVAIAETDAMDVHQIAKIGVACVSNDGALAHEILDHVLDDLQSHVEAEVIVLEMRLETVE